LLRDIARPDASVVQLRPHEEWTSANDHFVEFYDDDDALVRSISRFISMGLARGEAARIVAGPVHRAALHAELSKSVDLTVARELGLYASLDAERTLGLFMKEGKPDPVAFDQIVGGVVDRATKGGRRVRVFGEMVAFLCRQGNETGAIALEELWNELATRQSFRLFCAYPSLFFDNDHAGLLDSVCSQHSHVILSAPA
jgi:DcmR-like sensory protein